MKASYNAIKLIESFEGCRLKSYKDAVGIWTIGYGHTKGVTAGQTITQKKAEEYLREDIVTAERHVNSYYDRYKWNQNEFDALVSFAFNIGSITQLTNNGKRTITEISNKILAYNKAGGKELVGLTRRRQAEKALFDKPTTIEQDKKAEKNNTQEVISMPTIKKGCNSRAVMIWQVILGMKGTDIDGMFGNITHQKTIEYQAQHNLTKDGIVGDKTWKVGFDSLWQAV